MAIVTSAFTAFHKMWFVTHREIPDPPQTLDMPIETHVYGFPMQFFAPDFDPPVDYTCVLTSVVFNNSSVGPPVGVGVIMTGLQDTDAIPTDLTEPTNIGDITDGNPITAKLLIAQPTFTRVVDGTTFLVGFRFAESFDAGLSPALSIDLQFTILTGGPPPPSDKSSHNNMALKAF